MTLKFAGCYQYLTPHAFLSLGLIVIIIPISSGNLTAHHWLFHAPPRYEKSLSTIIDFAFINYRCVQVTTDKSMMALEILSQMFSSKSFTSFVNGVNIKLKSCNGYILIAKHLKDILILLTNIPLWYEHRIVCLLGGGRHVHLNYFIQEANKAFNDAEVLLVIFGKKTLYFQRKQPFMVLKPLKELQGFWHKEEYGVSDFMGKEITIGVFNCSIFAKLGPIDKHGKTAWVKGADMKLLQEILTRLNLTYRMKTPKELDKWGKFENGKWSGGIMGMAAKGKVDLAACGIWIIWPLMVSEVEMSFPMAQICLKMLVPRPRKLNNHWQDIYSPFSKTLWAFIIALIFISTFLLQFFLKLKNTIRQTRKDCTYFECFFRAISIFLLNGIPKTEQGSLRQLVTWMVVQSFVLTTCFSSNLFSHLTTPRYSAKLEDFKDLVENDFFWTEQFIPDLDIMMDLEDYWQNRWANKIQIFTTTEEKIRLAKTGKNIFFGQQFDNGFFLDTEYPEKILQDYEATSYCVNKYFLGFAQRKGSPFILPIRKYIHRFNNGGFIQQIIKNGVNEMVPKHPYMKEVLLFTKSQIGEPKKLTLENLSGAFFILAVGLSSSFTTFLLENFINKKYKNSKRVKKNIFQVHPFIL